MRPRTLAICLAAALPACTRAHYAPRLLAADAAPAATRGATLKVHLRSGHLVVFDRWTESDTALGGEGARYDAQRHLVRTGRFTVALDSIALLETRVRAGARATPVVGMAVWSVLWGVTTAVCVIDPKACFGSCPTFYVATDSGEALAAEGFSSSIARALEATDLDALFPATPPGGRFTVRMRNEALETHAVRSLRLVAAPRPAGGRVLAGPGDTLYPAARLAPPRACRGPEGDCLAPLAARDGVERFSPADSANLAASETLELTFPPVGERVGLVVGVRQSLLSTYLFYQTMGFLGTRAGEALAALETGGADVARAAMGMARLVGTIVVDRWDGDGWVEVGRYTEAGPLASETHVLPFVQRPDDDVRVRLRLTRGGWRLDWVALATLSAPVTPLRLEPVGATPVDSASPDPVALARLRDTARYLVTYPGDAYDIAFQLPPLDGTWEVFLESRGYYYEWMRAEWLADEDPALAALALGRPAQALRVLAPAYKRAEPQMERLFWSSRFGR